MESIRKFHRWIEDSNEVVFFGGAGVSTESGIPDFRSVDGLYNQKFEFPPERIISRSFFEDDPSYFYRFYREKMMPMGYEPNVTHHVLADWEEKGKLKAIITQNIDGLHQKAGSERVYELHGSIYRNFCMKCGSFYDAEYVKKAVDIPKCKCGGVVKPDVVLYEEGLDEQIVENAIEAISNAEVLIVAGTSLTVYPAAGLIKYYSGDKLVLINRDPTPYDGIADLIIREQLGVVFGSF